MNSTKKNYDHLVKLIIIGDSSVGKSCMLLRFAEDSFPTNHMPTIGKQLLTRRHRLQNKNYFRQRAASQAASLGHGWPRALSHHHVDLLQRRNGHSARL